MLGSNEHLVWGELLLSPFWSRWTNSIGSNLLLTNFPRQGRVFMHRHCETNMLLFFSGESQDCRATPHWLFHKGRLLGSRAFLQKRHLYPLAAISSPNRNWHRQCVLLCNRLQLCLATFSGSVFSHPWKVFLWVLVVSTFIHLFFPFNPIWVLCSAALSCCSFFS